MPPGETPDPSDQPPSERAPFPRRRGGSIDGVMGQPVRRPVAPGPPVSRPFAPRPGMASPARPIMADVQRPMPAQPPASPAPVLDAGASPTPLALDSNTPAPAALAPAAPVPTTMTSPVRRAVDNFRPVTSQTSVPMNAGTATADQAQAVVPAPKKPKRHIPWRRILVTAAIILAVLAIGAGVAVWLHIRAAQNNPDTIFREALQSSLSTRQIQADTASSAGSSQVEYDFSNLTDPLVSAESSLSLFGANFQLQGYGSAKNTYVSYAKFPAAIASNITSVAQNAWVNLRADGSLPPGVSGTLSSLADPRYQDFGPVLFGNFPLATRTQLVKYVQTQHIYAYQPAQVRHAELNGGKVLAYPITINVNYLKILMESAAASEGFTPADIQAAVNALNALKGDQATLYISADSHRIVQLSLQKSGQTATISYTGYNKLSLPGEPQTKLTWLDFAPVQLKIEQQAAGHQTAAVLDAERQADLVQLKSYLTGYYITNGFYPTYPNLDDQSWVATNLPGADPDVFRDPLGTALSLTSTPKKGSYTYRPVTPLGKACDNNQTAAVSQLCNSYTLTAILSTGKPYDVTN